MTETPKNNSMEKLTNEELYMKKRFHQSCINTINTELEKRKITIKNTNTEAKKKIIIKPKTVETKTDNKDNKDKKYTMANIKKTLDKHNIKYKSKDKKDDLMTLIRKHNLVRELEKY